MTSEERVNEAALQMLSAGYFGSAALFELMRTEKAQKCMRNDQAELANLIVREATRMALEHARRLEEMRKKGEERGRSEGLAGGA